MTDRRIVTLYTWDGQPGTLAAQPKAEVPVEPDTRIAEIFDEAEISYFHPFAVRQTDYDDDLNRYVVERDFEGAPLVLTLTENGRVLWLSPTAATWRDYERAFEAGFLGGDSVTDLVVYRPGGAAGGFDFLFPFIYFFAGQVSQSVLSSLASKAVDGAVSDLRSWYRKRLYLEWRRTGLNAWLLERMLNRQKEWSASDVARLLGFTSTGEAELLLTHFGYEVGEFQLWRRSTLVEAIRRREELFKAAEQYLEPPPEWLD